MTVSETSLRLLKIIDRNRLEEALAGFVSKHLWEAEFVEANQDHRYTNEQIGEIQKKCKNSVQGITFDNKVVLKLLTYDINPAGIKIYFWLGYCGERVPDGWFFFVHLLDRNGNIIGNQGRSLHEMNIPLLEKYAALDSINFRGVHIDDVHEVAFGIFNPIVGLMRADSGVRDWENKRVILKLIR